MEFAPVPRAHQFSLAAAPARCHPLNWGSTESPAGCWADWDAATSCVPPRHLGASPAASSGRRLSTVPCPAENSRGSSGGKGRPDGADRPRRRGEHRFLLRARRPNPRSRASFHPLVRVAFPGRPQRGCPPPHWRRPPTAPGQRRTTMDNTDTWEVSDGLTSFRTVLQRFAMETTTDGACPPISRAREGAGVVRLDGPTGRADRLGEPAWRRVHPLPALGMAPVRPLQDATQRGIALEKQIRRQTSRGLMRRGKTWAYPRASLERGARERVKEADAAR